MACVPWDVICILGEMLAPALSIIWMFIQVMAFTFGAVIVFMITRKVYKGRFIEINVLLALWAGYLAYMVAGWLALFSAVAAVVVILLAIFTPVGGLIATFVLSKVGK